MVNIIVWFGNKKITCSCGNFYVLKDSIKSCSGAKFNWDTKHWSVTNTQNNYSILSEFMQEHDRQEVSKTFNDYQSRINKYPYLYSFQKETLLEIKNGKNLISLPVGTGKTIIGFTHALVNNSKKVLIICPAPLKQKWQDDIKQFTNIESVIIAGTKTKREKTIKEYALSDTIFLIMNYEQIKTSDELQRIKFDIIILDEIHRIKSYKTQTHKAVKKLSCYEKIGLTATPFINTPFELYTIVKYLNHAFISWNLFTTQFCVWDRITVRYGEKKNVIVGYKNLEKLNVFLKSKIMVRRPKEELFKDFPPRVYKNYNIELSQVQRKYYNHFMDNKEENNLLASLSLALMVCNGTNIINESDSPMIKELDTAPFKSSKIDVLKPLLMTIEGKVLIFTQWVITAKMIYDNIPCCDIITGKTKDKKKVIDEFKTNNKKILISTDCLNYGIDLQFIHTLVHFDLHWSPARIEQREGRIDRIGSTAKHLLIIKLLTKEEQLVLDILKKKSLMFDKVIDESKNKKMIQEQYTDMIHF